MVRRRTSARKKRTAYAALGAAPARRGGGWVILVLGALVVVNLYVFVWDGKTGVRAIREQAEARSASLAVPTTPLAPAAAGTSIAPAAMLAVPGAVNSTPPIAPPAGGSATTPSAPHAIVRAGATVEGKVGKADTLGRLLKHNGLSAAETDEIIRALSGALDFRTIRAGQTYRIERGADGRVSNFDLEIGKARHVHAQRQASGELRVITDAT